MGQGQWHGRSDAGLVSGHLGASHAHLAVAGVLYSAYMGAANDNSQKPLLENWLYTSL
jgi:hypothetical protein